MMRKRWWIAAALTAFVGCNSNKDEVVGPSTGAPKAGASEPAPVNLTEVKLTQAEIDNINTLPEADRAAALAQKVCPISGEHLGSMDKPLKVTADGKTAFLCCESCESKFKKDPAGALAKLGGGK